MSVGKLWTYPGQFSAIRIQAVAAVGGVEITIAEGYEYGVTNKTPEFLAKFPMGKVPALETPSGLNIFEGTAIARYVSALAKNSNLLGSSNVEEAEVDQWVSFGTQELGIPLDLIYTLLNNPSTPYNKPADVFYREKAQRAIEVLEKVLHTKTYLVGDRITLADITVASVLKNYFSKLGDEAQRSKHPNTVRFYNTIANNPKIKPVWGETNFVEKAVQYVPPAKTAKK